jgi:hypothetical protein
LAARYDRGEEGTTLLRRCNAAFRADAHDKEAILQNGDKYTTLNNTLSDVQRDYIYSRAKDVPQEPAETIRPQMTGYLPHRLERMNW